MKRLIRVAAACAALSLGGCYLAIQDPTTDPATRNAAIAARFQQDFHQGGMAGVIDDIEKCYAASSTPIIKVNALRDCMVLDYTGYRTDVTVGQGILKEAPFPYFEVRTVADRLKHYSHLAEMDDPIQSATYLRVAYEQITRDMVSMTQGPIVVHGPPPNSIMGP